MILRSQNVEREDENSSRALMKKAHELHNISNSESKKSERQQQLAKRAQRVMQDEMDLPAIEEAFDKENDTFAQGGPLAGLARKIGREPKEISRDRSGIRSASSA